MILAPRMIQSMEILQLPIMALQERIQQELQENPVLELKEDQRTRPADDPTSAEPAADEEATPTHRAGAGHRRQRRQRAGLRPPRSAQPDWDDHFNEEHRPSRNGIDEEGDKKHDAMQNMAVAAAVAAGLPQRPARLPRHRRPSRRGWCAT